MRLRFYGRHQSRLSFAYLNSFWHRASQAHVVSSSILSLEEANHRCLRMLLRADNHNQHHQSGVSPILTHRNDGGPCLRACFRRMLWLNDNPVFLPEPCDHNATDTISMSMPRPCSLWSTTLQVDLILLL